MKVPSRLKKAPDKSTEQEVTQVKAKRLMAEIFLEKEKDQAADKTRIVDLQKALVETMQARVNEIESGIQHDRYSKITILHAAERLMEAHLALAADKKSRIQIMETYLQRLLGYESLFKQELMAGKGTAHEFAQVKAKRLMAEILLEKEKGK